jgi:hypothetical protein
MKPHLVKPDDDDDVDVLLRLLDGLFTILWQMKTAGHLSRYEIAVISAGNAIADRIRRRHVGS